MQNARESFRTVRDAVLLIVGLAMIVAMLAIMGCAAWQGEHGRSAVDGYGRFRMDDVPVDPHMADRVMLAGGHAAIDNAEAYRIRRTTYMCQQGWEAVLERCRREGLSDADRALCRRDLQRPPWCASNFGTGAYLYSYPAWLCANPADCQGPGLPPLTPRSGTSPDPTTPGAVEPAMFPSPYSYGTYGANPSCGRAPWHAVRLENQFSVPVRFAVASSVSGGEIVAQTPIIRPGASGGVCVPRQDPSQSFAIQVSITLVGEWVVPDPSERFEAVQQPFVYQATLAPWRGEPAHLGFDPTLF